MTKILPKLNVKMDGDRQTMVEVAKWKNGIAGGKLVRPKPGVPEDIKYNASCMAVVRIGSGVWFKGKMFGTSLVAAKVLCVNSEDGGPNKSITDYTIDIEVFVQSKAAGQQEAEQRALVLANAVEDVLADYPSLDDGVTGLMFIEASGMSMSAAEAGIDGPRIQVTVQATVKARLQ